MGPVITIRFRVHLSMVHRVLPVLGWRYVIRFWGRLSVVYRVLPVLGWRSVIRFRGRLSLVYRVLLVPPCLVTELLSWVSAAHLSPYLGHCSPTAPLSPEITEIRVGQVTVWNTETERDICWGRTELDRPSHPTSCSRYYRSFSIQWFDVKKDGKG